MTEAFDPPLSGGLEHGDRYPEDDTTHTGPGCYVLRLHQPTDLDTLRERWHARYDIEPPTSISVEAFDASAVYYVGAAKHVLERIHTHLDHANRSGAITAAYPIHSVAEVYPEQHAGDAFEWESRRAFAWRDAHADAAVWINGELL